jgi:hypothetical protein
MVKRVADRFEGRRSQDENGIQEIGGNFTGNAGQEWSIRRCESRMESDLIDRRDANLRTTLRRLFGEKVPVLNCGERLLKIKGGGVPDRVNVEVGRKQVVVILPGQGSVRRGCKEKRREKEKDGSRPIAGVSVLGH